MPLSADTKLGPYEILAPIGAGGMGEVYKARDPRLDRTVAIKISKADFTERFAREARLVAQLNHPNICTLHDVGPNYLVMEFVEGTPLKGPLPAEKAVEYAGQILDALDAAHRKGITHRDLKPANILVTKQGIKLLDFGLAKQGAGFGPDDVTRTALTMEGQITGTLQYMSPEQLQGKEAYARSDIFSFGCVLYEMLSGTQAFGGTNAASVIAAILEREPEPLKATPPLDRVIRACLAKDPDQRFQTALDLKRSLMWAMETEPVTTAPSPSRLGKSVPWAVAAVAAVAAMGLGWVAYHHYSEEPQVLKMLLRTPEKAQLGNPAAIPMISPDGRHVAFAAVVDGQRSLWVRNLDALSAHQLPGTTGAAFPFWSADSRWVAFFADGKLKKIDVTGGPALTLCVCQGRLGTWNKDDVIVYGTAGRLFRVPAAGGAPVELSESDPASPQRGRRAPWFLPDGRHFLYMARYANAQQTRIYVDTIDAKPGTNSRREVLVANSNAVYVPSSHAKWIGGSPFGSNEGYVLFLRERTLMAQPFDATKTQTTGDAVPIAEQVDDWQFNSDRQGQFSASQNGTLVYTSGETAGGNVQLTWFDRSGKPGGTVGTPGAIRGATISPDGATVAADRLDASAVRDIWRYDLARGTASQFTFGPANNQYPLWSPDGSKIIFHSLRDNGKPYQKATSGVGPEEVLDNDPRNNRVTDWSHDGRYLIEQVQDTQDRTDIWVIPTFGDKKPFPYISTEFFEGDAKLSPNGQFLAYDSDESKRREVYVQTFPEHGGKWQVSTGGGDYPVWSRDGHELYFISADGKLMAVDVKGDGKKFEAGVPKPLFDVRQVDQFDVSKDGRFLIKVPLDAAAANVPITAIVNWQAGLKK